MNSLRLLVCAKLLEDFLIGLADEMEDALRTSTDEVCYVTIQQMAAIVMRGKRTLERLISKGVLPERSAAAGVALANGSGRSSARSWKSTVGENFQERFPASQFVRN